MIRVTENELIDALRSALATSGAEDAQTITDIAITLGGMDERKLRRAMRVLIVEGKVECVPVTMTRINGVVARTTGYRLLDRKDDANHVQ